jgi:hypothetical protein
MGKGVIAYWTNAQLLTLVAPVVTLAQIATGATANLFATKNTVINPGIWVGANDVAAPSVNQNPNKRIIAPKNWFTDQKPLNDLYPNNFIII